MNQVMTTGKRRYGDGIEATSEQARAAERRAVQKRGGGIPKSWDTNSRSPHFAVLQREVTGGDIGRLNLMSVDQRRSYFDMIVLHPIMCEDMPDLLKLNDAEDIDGLRLSLRSSEEGFHSDIDVSWNGHIFTAKAAAHHSNIVKKLIHDAIPPVLDPNVVNEMFHEATHPPIIWDKNSKKLELALKPITTLDNLHSLAPAFRMMCSIVFRDPWLLHLIKLEPSWRKKYLWSYGEEKLWLETSYNLWNHEHNDYLLRVVVSAPCTNASIDHTGSVLIQDDISQSRGYNAYFWKDRFDALIENEDLFHRIKPCDIVSRGVWNNSIMIQNYTTHADAERVMLALRFLLSSR